MNKSGIAAIAASQHIKEGDYWLSKLSGELTKSFFPYDHNITEDDMEKAKTEKVSFELSGEVYAKLAKLSNGADARLYMILVTGISLLLDRYTGNNDVIIGAPIFKQDVEAEFVNTILALRNEIDRQGTFKDLLLKVKDTIFEASENQNYPMETLLYQLGMERDEYSFPLFDVIVLLENVHDRKYLNNIKTSMLMSFKNTGSSLMGVIEYNSSLYEKDTIERIITHLQNVFAFGTSNVNVKLAEINILQEAEKELIMTGFNNSSADYPSHMTIYRLFEEQVMLTPDCTAVQYENEKLTYDELNKKANSLARLLRENGVGASEGNNIVAIMVDRSLEMIVGIMAILKAGGAYMPVDPEYPAERKQFMLKDSEARVLLVKGAVSDNLEFEGLVIDLEKEKNYLADASNLEINKTSKSLAYIIYTSGSTGQPKGVLVEHASIVNTLTWRKAYYQFNERDAVLQIPSFSFDSSVEDIFTPLISGSKLVMVNNQNRFNIAYLQEIVTDCKVTHFLITPGLYKVFMDEYPESLKYLRIITVAGDKFNEDLVKEHFSKLNNVRFINEYGPTENSVCSTVYEITPDNMKVLIGKPINNVKCFIVDKYGSLCPIGIPGELCVSGTGIAKGYLNRPELTSEKFTNNPFVEGERLYKTGDLARWLPDGNIEFLGRMDHQVKIRGFRIELGEIENQLLTHEQVKETLVVAKENTDGTKYLVQYFVAAEKLTVPELRWCLADALPEYMIPSHFVQLDRMPLTPNGKIDRRALPEPEDNCGSQAEYEEPTTETEAQLVETWKEILDLEKIGINDNFFEIGGHSLRATILVSQVRKRFHVDVPLREIFRKPTIKQLAKYIERGEKNIYVSIQPVEQKEYYQASPAQKRMYLVNKVDGIGVTYNVPLAIYIDGHLDKEKTQNAFSEIVRRHEAFRTSFEFIDNELVQRVHTNVDFNIEYLEAEENQVDEIAEKFVHTFDFKAAPLLRVLLVNLKEGRSIVMTDMHHIISDGVSMDILVKEFVSLYEAKELPELRIQYRDFTAWQNTMINSEAMNEQKKFWLEQFSGELPVLNMPTDYPRPSVQSFEGAKVRISVDEETTTELLGLANKSGTTLFSVMLGAYNVMLSKYSGQDDIVVGTPIAGRTSSDLENVIGMFINMLALRNYPVSTKSFKEFLREVGENSINAFENQDYQFNDLVDALRPDRNMSRSPLFDTMFALQNMEFRQNQIDGINFSLEDIETKISKFDITTIAIERNSKIDLIFEYCTKLFKKETIERFAKHFVKLLKEVVKNPDKKLNELQMISQEEQNQILNDFNNNNVEYDRSKTIQQLFEEQAEKTPNNVVAVYNDKVMTYEELNEKSNQLANTLKNNNINREAIVGIMVEESLEMLVGIMGILKAGAAYLPIDPQYPQDRVNYMLEDSKAVMLLTQEHLLEQVNYAGTILNLDNGASYAADTANLAVECKACDTAYVIYTSGSTGKPKGVMVQHKALANLCQWHNKHYELTAEDKATKYAGFGFDASVWEIFPYILCGASLHLIDKKIKLDTIKLNNYFEKNNITISFLPTQICEQFMDLNNTSLRKLLTGGDKLNQFTARGYELVNNYGPTENTVVATSFVVDGAYSNIPIGKPVYNTKAYILDKHNNLQPIGVPGELCLSGDSLAKGYLHKPELTAEKFVANPFENNKVMYRTGDLVKWLPDGNIEFLGRIDYQVKIRGNRIELGEIENQLLKHEDIKEAVVIARDDKGENKYLCAYLVSERELTVVEIKEHLSKELPEYMIPSYFVQLDAIPMNANGKVDKKALPEPDGSISTGVEYTAPASETEERLVAIWHQVLGAERIGTNDNFFDLGGNSLLMMKVISKICSDFNVSEEEITVMTMFKYPTIALMAKQLDGESAVDKRSFEKISSRIEKRNQAARRNANGRGRND